MSTRMQQRRGTAAQWIAANTLLAAGEIGFESDTDKFKMGDGSTLWADLPYFENADGIGGSLAEYIPLTQKNSPNGVATLDADSQVPASQLGNVDFTGYATETYSSTAASNAEQSAKNYADSLASNYDAAGTAATEVSNHSSDTTNVHGIADTSQLATKSYTDTAVSNAVAAVIDSAPQTLDTLRELASAINDDANFFGTIQTFVNNSISSEVTDRNVAIENAVLTAIGTEVTNRNVAISDAIGVEVTDRNQAISTAIQEEVLDRNIAIDTALQDSIVVDPGLTKSYDTQSKTLTIGVSNTLTTDTELATAISDHNTITTNVHGISDTAELATKSYADTSVMTHNIATTNVHGIADTSLLETQSGAQTKADAALTSANNYSDINLGNANTYTNNKVAEITNSSTSENIPDTIVKRNTGGSFSTSDITVNEVKFTGNAGSVYANTSGMSIFSQYGDITLGSQGGQVKIGGGQVTTEDNSQTLTNKTIDTANNSITVVASDISDITAAAYELNVLDGITATTTELNYVNGVTSSIQDQLDNKQDKVAATPTTLGTVYGLTDSGTGGNGTLNTLLGHNSALADSTNYQSTAIGAGANSSSESTAVGAGATASPGAVAVGNIAFAQSAGVAIGNASFAGNDSISIGNFAGSDDTLNKESRLRIGSGYNAAPLIYGEFDNQYVKINGSFEANDPTFNIAISGNSYTISPSELSQLDGVISPIQNQIDGKLSISAGLGDLSDVADYLDMNAGVGDVLTFDGSNGWTTSNVASAVVLPSTTSIGSVSATEIGYLDGVTSSIQDQINAKAPLAGPTLTGTTNVNDLVIGGTLTFSGTAQEITSTNLSITDSLIYLADQQFDSDAVDIGIYGAYGDSNPGHFHTGLFRDASDGGKWKLISGGAEPNGNVIDLTGVTYDTLKLGTLEATSATIGNVSNTELQYLDGVTSAIQTQIDAKAPTANPTFTGTVSGITKSMVGLGNVDNTTDANKPISSATQTALDAKAPIASPTFTGTVSGITKSMVGLGSVDNTSDASKPISTATQTALDAKAPINNPTFTGTVSGITKSMVGLSNVDNTSDASKPVSTATQAALDLKAPKESPVFTGSVTMPFTTAGIVTSTSGGVIGTESFPKLQADLFGFAATATAAGTTTLTNTSTEYQLFTGTANQTIVLPVTNTLQGGWTFHIVNNSTGTLTVNSSGGNLIGTVPSNITMMATCIGTSSSTASDWEFGYTDFGTLTGTGSVVLAASPTITTPTIAGTATLSSSGLTFSDSTVQVTAGVPSLTTINQQSGAYTPVLSDRDKLIEVSSASAVTLTIPTNASVAYPVGTSFDILQTGAGQITIAGASGVTVNATPGLKLRTQWSSATIFKRATDTWVVYGDLTA